MERTYASTAPRSPQLSPLAELSPSSAPVMLLPLLGMPFLSTRQSPTPPTGLSDWPTRGSLLSDDRQSQALLLWDTSPARPPPAPHMEWTAASLVPMRQLPRSTLVVNNILLQCVCHPPESNGGGGMECWLTSAGERPQSSEWVVLEGTRKPQGVLTT